MGEGYGFLANLYSEYSRYSEVVLYYNPPFFSAAFASYR